MQKNKYPFNKSIQDRIIRKPSLPIKSNNKIEQIQINKNKNNYSCLSDRLPQKNNSKQIQKKQYSIHQKVYGRYYWLGILRNCYQIIIKQSLPIKQQNNISKINQPTVKKHILINTLLKNKNKQYYQYIDNYCNKWEQKFNINDIYQLILYYLKDDFTIDDIYYSLISQKKYTKDRNISVRSLEDYDTDRVQIKKNNNKNALKKYSQNQIPKTKIIPIKNPLKKIEFEQKKIKKIKKPIMKIFSDLHHDQIIETARFQQHQENHQDQNYNSRQEKECLEKSQIKQQDSSFINKNHLENLAVELPHQYLSISKQTLDKQKMQYTTNITNSGQQKIQQDSIFPNQVSEHKQLSNPLEIELSSLDQSNFFNSSQYALENIQQKLSKIMNKIKDQPTKSFLKQLLKNQVYKDQKGNFFHAVKLSNLESNINQFLNKYSIEIQKYLSCIIALKITSSHIQQIPTLLHPSLRILNLSHNNLKSLTIPNLNCLQFININQNQIRNIHNLLNISSLIQLHVNNNLIDHISGTIQAKNITILDLSYNMIEKQYDLSGLKQLNFLKIINIIGNPMKSLKRQLGLSLTEYPELYIFSNYKQYKDITFRTSQQKYLTNNKTLYSQNSKDISPKQQSKINKLQKILQMPILPNVPITQTLYSSNSFVGTGKSINNKDKSLQNCIIQSQNIQKSKKQQKSNINQQNKHKLKSKSFCNLSDITNNVIIPQYNHKNQDKNYFHFIKGINNLSYKSKILFKKKF